MRSTYGAFVDVSEPAMFSCPVCNDQRWFVQKTSPHQGKTLLHGQFDARQRVYICQSGCVDSKGRKITSASLSGHLLPNRTVGYDVMDFIGKKRFLECRQREEIQAMLLDNYGIRLSTGEISNLTKLFAQYMGRLHRARSESLKNALISDGGWPMHVDATGEKGRGTIFVVMAGWREWVLGSWKVATENTNLILPCMRETVRLFGAPCAIMRDMGRAVTPAAKGLVAELKLEIPVLTCHQHFTADIGKDLLNSSHTAMRELFRRTGIRKKLREFARELGREIGEAIPEARKAVCDWQVMADNGHRVPSGREGLAVVRSATQWTLDYVADSTGLDFPYDREYLDFYHRCQVALRASDAFLRTPPKDQKVVRFLERLNRLLSPIETEEAFHKNAVLISRRAKLFDEMRDTLRLAEKYPKGETQQEIENMYLQFQKWTVSIAKRRPISGPAKDQREAIDIILKHIQEHGETLWGHAIPVMTDLGTQIRLVTRTNYLPENLFKDLKHGERCRSGRKILTQDLEHMPAEALLVLNLKHDDYVKIICGSIDLLPEAFAELDKDDRKRRMIGQQSSYDDGLGKILQIPTASLSTDDRRLVRTKAMDSRMHGAANSRSPRYLN